MFDSVGKTIDPDAGRRRVYSASLTLLLLGSTIGGTFAYLTWQAARIVYEELIIDDEMVEVEMIEEAPEELEAPPPPPPEPMLQAGGLADEEEPEDPVEPVADEMQDDIKELDDEVKDDVTSQAGNPDADPNTAGTADGSKDGQGGGNQVAGPRVFHHSEVTIKRQVTPIYPEAAKDLNLGDVTCRVRIFIDAEGVPYDFVFESCPKPFHDSSREALLKWRWYPAKMGGEKVAAQFVMVFKYTLK